jgi:hypothetical protein
VSQRRPHPIAIVALCFVLSGCGGEGSSRLTGRQLVRRAQAICLEAQAAAGAMLPPSHEAGLAGIAGYFERSAAIAQAKTNRLKALRLRPAAMVVRQWRQVIAAEEAFTTRLQSLGAAAASGDVGRLELVEADTGPEQQLIGRATNLKVTLCAP